VVVRAVDVQHAVQRQIEVAVVGHQSAQAGRGDGHAVVRALARDDLLLARLADGVVVVPDQLDGRVVGLGARVREEHLGHGHRCEREQLLGQRDHRGFERPLNVW
jgi:hypothetical protein